MKFLDFRHLRSAHGLLVMMAVAGTFVVQPLGTAVVAAAEQAAAKVEFFESRIRPVLVGQCYSCHNSADTSEGGLAVDHRAALLKGGDSGAGLIPGSAKESLLLRVIRHEVDGMQMPQDAPKLDDDVIADFEQWVADGAVDPRDKPPSPAELAQLMSWEGMRDRRMGWWSFQPVSDPPPPEVDGEQWAAHPIDRFIRAKMQAADLTPSPLADRRTLVRRLSFAITGLPPTADRIERFLTDESANAYERLADELLASEHFGEQWARHWMDWMRYAETHGSEGDPAIPHAWRYRDYLIRALNADVPYDRLVREHIAGDLLPGPRLNDELGINESMLGAAQYRFVQHGFAPTDALDEQVRFTDNQIDVISKAFLGLTVSCARCHDHKFDPISQQDYYALYGIMVSSRPATVTLDTPERQNRHREELTALKEQLRASLADTWLAASESVAEQLQSLDGPWADAVKQAGGAKHPLHVWSQLQSLSGEEFSVSWSRLAGEYAQSRARLQQRTEQTYPWRSDLSRSADFKQWFRHGTGLQDDEPARAGEFAIDPEGDRIVSEILPAGIFSNRLSTKHNGVLMSRRIRLDAPHLYLRVRGDGGARARYAVQHYPRQGTVYPLQKLNDGREQWIHWDVSYWQGDDIHIEVATAADVPVELAINAVRSSFGVAEAVLLSEEQQQAGLAPQDEMAEFVAPLFEAAGSKTPTDPETLAALYADALRASLIAWRDGEMTDGQSRFLNTFVRDGLLPDRLSELNDRPALARLVEAYRALEADIPVPTRAPGVLEADVIDQPLFTRGSHKRPGEPVPRRFLEAFDAEPYGSTNSGRLELADDLLRADNPLTARVIVNRVWHHLFGRGLVATPDNFGHVGAVPSHPQLLDWLATRFVEDGWSLKRLIRQIVTSRTYQLNSTPTAEAAAQDPDNVLLSHAPLRRLEAESVRDAMLAATGELDLALFGTPKNADSNRRSVYLTVRRNSMIPLLTVFDQPTPFSTKGRRDVTNVPGQSLTLMNDPFVNAVARRWAERLLAEQSGESDAARIAQMFESVLGRSPSAADVERTQRYLQSADESYAAASERLNALAAEPKRLRNEREALLQPIRDRLMAARSNPEASTAAALRPVAQWEFDDDLSDSLGTLHGTAQGNAVVADGALVVDGQSYVVTAPLERKLQAKTLEAWVQLDNVDQQGGGIMSVQTTNGVTFDAIVFGERQPGHWLSGSNGFRRTKDFGGPQEKAARDEPVHVAIVYHADGRIIGYRNGEPYGKPYQSSGLQPFAAGQSVLTFGLRHLPAGGNRYITGRILRARLYDRALGDEEVAASARDDVNFVSLAALVADMTPSQRQTYDRLSTSLQQAETEQQQLEAVSRDAGPARVWQELAMTLFNLKEFLYVR